ncbi:hypothetical protein [Catenulispora subtropica]|uniref:Uncharacterized protein n=1 Tax=Catenulispora subtropica TaxID=450798 RepID=A0ABN2RK51_9ACTN
MGSERGDSGRGHPSDASAAGGPAPIEVELVEEDVLPEAAPNTAASGLETIGGGFAGPSRLLRVPRALRVLGALAAVAGLTIALWPAPGGRPAAKPPVPQTTVTIQPPVNVDLYKVRVSGTTLSQDYRDHAVMGLALANESSSQLTVVTAELWDALGTRLGSSASWPAGYVLPRTSETLPLELPYSCGVPWTTPVLPVTIRYSVSTPEDMTVSHNYEYPLDQPILDAFIQARAGLCTGPAGGVFATSVDMVRQVGDHHDRHGFDLMITVDAAGAPDWTVRAISADIPGVTVTSPDLPIALTTARSAQIRAHWTYADCVSPPQWGDGFSAIQLTARPAGAPATGSGDQHLMVYLRPELLTKMLQAACWQ